MARIGYFRTSTRDQSVDSQKYVLGEHFDREFVDEGISGAVPACNRPAFGAMLRYVREGDSIHVFSVDRLGRDAIDVQTNVRGLIDRGVIIEVHGLGQIGRGAGELILAVLAQLSDMERGRIVDRCNSGRATARASLAATGLTHRGKKSLGRPPKHDSATVAGWRRQHGASIAETARHFAISSATVKRHCAS